MSAAVIKTEASQKRRNFISKFLIYFFLIGSAQFVVEPEPVPLPWNPESAAVFTCLRPFDRSLPLQRSPVPVPVHRRTGSDDRHILHLSRHKIRKTGRKSLSAEEVSGFHSHL